MYDAANNQLMEIKTSFFTIWVIITHLLPLSSSLSINDDLHDPIALDSYLHNHTFSSIPRTKLGVLNNVSLPSNFSGIGVSIVRMKRATIWRRGARFEPLFNIPPKIILLPLVMRLQIMYENLGNWSSYYYNLPNYKILSPVIGLTFYDAGSSKNNAHQKLNLTVHDKPISINFTTIISPNFKMTHQAKCVRFDVNGLVELSEMVSPCVCKSRHDGHFTLASKIVHPPPKPENPPPQRRKKDEQWHWWVIGLGVGLFAVIVVAMVACRGFVLRKMKLMEKRSDQSEVLGVRWIRDSRMPVAAMTRTQPALEVDQ